MGEPPGRGNALRWALAGTALVLVAVVTAVILNFVGVFAFTSLDGREVAAQISTRLSRDAGQKVNVTCPASIPEKKGGIEDCQADAGRGVTLVRVVQDDSRGHFHYNVADPAALAASPSSSDLPRTPRSQDEYGTLEADFLQACNATGGRSGYCECVLSELQSHGGPAEIARLDQMVRNKETLPPETVALMLGCG